jgi:hypothetical protein
MIEGILLLCCLVGGCGIAAVVALAIAWDMTVRDVLAWVWFEVKEVLKKAAGFNPYE